MDMRITFTLCLILCTSMPALSSDIGKSDSITVASLSIFPVKWDKQSNADKITDMVRQAATEGAQLIITPEGVLEGYVVNEVNNEQDPAHKAELTRRFRELAEPIDGRYMQRFFSLADELDVYLILGFLEAAGDTIYNSAALIGPDGELVGKYHKTHFWQGYDINPPGYTPGKEYPVFKIGDMTIGMMICADRRFPEVGRMLALQGANLVACPAYGSWGERNNAVMITRAFENQVNVVFTHPNQSLIIDNDGKIVGECAKDSYVIRKISVARAEKRRPTVIYRRPESYDALTMPE